MRGREKRTWSRRDAASRRRSSSSLPNERIRLWLWPSSRLSRMRRIRPLKERRSRLTSIYLGPTVWSGMSLISWKKNKKSFLWATIKIIDFRWPSRRRRKLRFIKIWWQWKTTLSNILRIANMIKNRKGCSRTYSQASTEANTRPWKIQS